MYVKTNVSSLSNMLAQICVPFPGEKDLKCVHTKKLLKSSCSQSQLGQHPVIQTCSVVSTVIDTDIKKLFPL